MSDLPSLYSSFLLRIWQSGAQESAGWRVSLEDTRTGERWGFASLEAAWAFLETQLRREARRSQAPERATRAGD